MSKKNGVFIIVLLLMLMIFCAKDEQTNNGINIPQAGGHEYLSEYNFFEGDIANMSPVDGILPYDLNMPLFSDYALKKRFIYVPDGSAASFDTSGVFDFPMGSVLIKHFYYENNDGSFNAVETRLLIHQAGGWQPYTYEWNQEGTEASKTVLGAVKSMDVTVDGLNHSFNYSIPNTNQCKNCHAFNGATLPIGPVAQNLNKDYSYTEGTSNQIEKWMSEGIISSGSISNLNAWPSMENNSASIESRARAYLSVNCSSCHRLEGSAANSGLYLEYHNQDSLSLGFFKTPVAAGSGSGGLEHVIEPGSAEQSILYYRINSDEVEVRMPELGRELLHQEGIDLIKEWIDNM
ncbi:MAG: SO2930 family diheme c-type cytochrome [Chitinophagales bacterium]